MTDNIEGLEIHDLKQINDDRGSVLHMLRSESVGFVKFGECYFSEIFQNKIKAWKKHCKQTQNISVPIGEIVLVIYDKRPYSSTNSNICLIKLGRPDNYKRVKIPPELWYGFKCVSDCNALIVNCADIPHEKNESKVIDIDSDLIPFSWNDINK